MLNNDNNDQETLTMNIREAAALLDTTPKNLRRELRRLDGFGGVGIGGTYDLTALQVHKLSKLVKPSLANVVDPHPELDQDKGINPLLLPAMRRDPATRREVLARRAARRQRLQARLSEPEVAQFIRERQAMALLEWDETHPLSTPELLPNL